MSVFSPEAALFSRGPRGRTGRGLGVLAALLLLAGSVGCASRPHVEIDWKGGPFFTPTNFSGPAQMPADIRRVAILPVAGLERYPEASTEGIIEALHVALGRNGRFEPILISPERWSAISGRASAGPNDALVATWFDALAREFGIDSVLLVEFTEFRAYPPLALGVRSKLARATGTREVVWSFDTTFDARNAAVANSVRRHAAKSSAGVPTDFGPLGLQSPRRFAAYAFDSTFAVLPERKSTLKPAKDSAKPADVPSTPN